MTLRPSTSRSPVEARRRSPDPGPGRWKQADRPPEGTTPVHQGALEDFQRAERSMVVVRWAGVVFAVVQVLAYREMPYPPGIKETALGLAGVLAVANMVLWTLYRRMETLRAARTLAIVSLGVDVGVASGFVWIYAFDPGSALWAVLFILPLEGAIRFGLAGAMWSWGVVTALYVGREIWGSDRYGYPLQPESISFRMGIGFLIALVAGLMARNLMRQRAHLANALSELSRVDALRSRMVATLAHDVRNPLTTIRGTLKTLARHSDRLPEDVRSELVSTADRQAGRLERLATELLDLARMEEGRLDLSVEDVALADAVDRGLSFADQERRFEVRIDPDLAVRADPARLEQIVVNLATNALRYGEAPFLVEAGRSREGTVGLSFRDHGPGVAEEDRASLFEPFRAESDGSPGSVGLGLAIVKALAEAQGGDVTYEPNRPRGACFTVELAGAGSAA